LFLIGVTSIAEFPSDGLRVDPVILSMRADEPDIDHAIWIVDPHDDAVLVARNVENRPAVMLLTER
jgi:hypothetical protein